MTSDTFIPPEDALTLASTGSPDDYGYTWNDTVPLDWVDAGGGTNVDFQYSGSYTDPIDLGFNFKFYENSYANVIVSRNGYLGFASPGMEYHQPKIPDPHKPNNIIVPYASPVDSIGGYIHYLRGGATPNRWFAVEWNRVQSSHDGMDEFTFEVILHENGDIVFQYKNMSYTGNYFCGTAGIEDSTGMDGLVSAISCSQVASNHAVRFTRPAPLGRVKIAPFYQGHFSSPGEWVTFQVSIFNTGELGADTFDLFPSSPWPVRLYATDGSTPLVDTDSDASLDTGPVAQGASFTVTVKVQTPTTAQMGDQAQSTLLVRSSLNTASSKTAQFDTAVPAPFAQAYRDYNQPGAGSLYLVQPGNQTLINVPSVNESWDPGAIVEAPNGNLIYAWSEDRCLDTSCARDVSEIYYTILDHYGNVLRPATQLTDHSLATMDSYDGPPALAVTPDGKIGMLWSRTVLNQNWSTNFNLYFAVLDPAGDLVTAPTNLTANNTWGWDSPRFNEKQMVASEDNRFIFTWTQSLLSMSGQLTDIFYTVRDAQNDGLGVINLTNSAPGGDEYAEPMLTALPGSHFLLGWKEIGGYESAIAYTVFSTSGSLIKPTTKINESGDYIDSVKLTDGRIVMAWTTTDSVHFAILDGGTYNLVAGPTSFSHPAALGGNGSLSVAADQFDQAILTWSDWNSSRNLYYALVNSQGQVVAKPMIFQTAQDPTDVGGIEASYYGYGNTSYTLTTSNETDVYLVAPVIAGVSRQGTAGISISYGNRGSNIANSVSITATLDSHLQYAGDNSGVSPSTSGNTISWNLPSALSSGASGQFTLFVKTPDAAIGTRYPISLRITTTSQDTVLSNNTQDLEVMVAHQMMLPVAIK